MEPVDTRKIRWSYNPDLKLIGTTAEVPVDRARALVAEGRARYADDTPTQSPADTGVGAEAPGGDDTATAEGRRHRTTKTE